MLNKYTRLTPFLVLLYFFIHYILEYFFFLEPKDVTLSLSKYFIGTTLIYIVGYKLFRNKEKYALVFTTMLFIFMFFGSIIDTLANYNIFKPSSAVYLKYLFAYATIGLILTVLTAWANQNTIQKFLRAWIIFALVVMVYDITGFIFKEKKDRKYLHAGQPIKLQADSSKPHVFFFLFDMYTSNTIYKNYLHYDNSSIHRYLTEKGFFVTRNSHSDYEFTHLSLSSTLNLEKLSYLNDKDLPEAKKALLSLKRAQNSSLLQGFLDAGYSINNFSFFNLLGHRSPLYFNLEDHLSSLITGTTLYNRFDYSAEVDLIRMNRDIDLRFWKNSWSDDTKNDIDYLKANFSKNLDACNASAKPTFNYFHFMIPHSPIIYDSMGKVLPLAAMYDIKNFDSAVAKYNGFTEYGNKLIKNMVGQILDTFGENAVIIIQGDHGFRDFDDDLPDEVKYGIFNSVYLPNKNYSNFRDTLTPIETFRLILKNQFYTSVQ